MNVMLLEAIAQLYNQWYQHHSYAKLWCQNDASTTWCTALKFHFMNEPPLTYNKKDTSGIDHDCAQASS